MDTPSVQPEWRYQIQRKWANNQLPAPTDKTTKSDVPGTNASDNFLRPIVDACVSNVAVLDEAGTVLYSSKAWSLFEQARNLPEFCTRFNESESDEGAEQTLADDIQEILCGKQTEFHRKYYCDSPIKLAPFMMHAARLNLPGPTFRVFLTHEEDATVRDDFHSNQKRLLDLLGTKNICAWEGRVEGQRFSYVSDQVVKMLGYAKSEWYEPHFLTSHIHPDDKRWVLAAYRKQTRVSEHFDLTFRLLAQDGRVVWVQNLVSVGYEQGHEQTMRGFMIDITERKQTERALKDLGGRLIAAQEEERRRVARELHDDFNQRLAVLSIELEQLGQKIQQPVSLRRNVQKLQKQAQEISAEIHRLSYKLHPSKLDHLGLAAAVKSLCNEISESGKLNVEFQQSGFPSLLSNDITLCIFRIAQESLRNCVKHSDAECARVVLAKTRDAVRLIVSDNGRGFETKPEIMERGLGFISMKERLHILGGDITVFSKPLRGTRIEVFVPLRPESENKQD